MSEVRVPTLSFEFDCANMFVPFLQADPSFRETWEAFQKEYRSDDDLPLYLVMSALARHLIQNLETGHTRQFGAVFDIVERWHVRGNPTVKEVVTVGLLEALQNGYLHRKTRPEDFLPWLQPETFRWWIKVQEFWQRESR